MQDVPVERDFSSRVFISREDADRRRITNTDDVKAALRPLGFEFYQPSHLSMTEEVSLFSQAEVVVGTVGSGIAGIIYSHDAALIELFPHDHFGVYYMSLCNELELDYDFLKGRPVPDDQETNPIHQDLQIDVDDLLKTVRNAI